MMTSSCDGLKLQYRMHPEIFTAASLETAFSALHLSNDDLLMVSGTVAKMLADSFHSIRSDIVCVSEYGKGEPREEWVNQIIRRANEKPYRRIISIGGGSVIDIAKFCVFGDSRELQQLFRDKEILVKTRQLVAIPTTCGTGSEVTSVAVVEMDQLHSKVGLQLPALFPDQAILISKLIRSLPISVFTATSIDAMSHAIESLLSPKHTAYTQVLSEQAIGMILTNLEESAQTGRLPTDLEKSLIAANMAGSAFSIAGCATMHALSFPLGARYHLSHGEAINAVLAATLEYYESSGINLHRLKTCISDALGIRENDALKALSKLLGNLHKIPDLKEMGMTDEDCHEMAESVFRNQQRLLVNAPETLSSIDLEIIYQHCLRKERGVGE